MQNLQWTILTLYQTLFTCYVEMINLWHISHSRWLLATDKHHSVCSFNSFCRQEDLAEIVPLLQKSSCLQMSVF